MATNHMKLTRRNFLRLTAVSGAATFAKPTTATAELSRTDAGRAAHVKPFELDEVTLAELQVRMASGRLSAATLTKKYLARISEIDRRGPTLRSVIELNPDALANAAAFDRERKSKGPRGPLHGIPVLIKDNIATHDRMTTTAGSLALAGSIAPRDAFVAERLRAAGVVILGKANLSEWANIRDDRSTSGWSGRGGQTRNPYALDRNPSGSSSGSAAAVAANLCAAAIGTETDGSILSPARMNGIVGLKPTVGLVSRSGIIPISRTQDTSGPMTRTVTDAAMLLGIMTGEDPRDPATAASAGNAHADYTRFLDADGLRGARIGVARKTFTGHPEVAPLMDRLLSEMTRRGAVLVDPVELPSGSAFEKAELEVLLYEFKAGLNDYLAELGPDAPAHTLRDIIEFNQRHAQQEMPWFKQANFLKAEAKGPLTDGTYLDALAKCRKATREEGIDALMDQHRLDAVFASGGGPAGVIDYAYGDSDTGGGGISPPAVAGYPSITIPAGFIAGMPVSVFFFGRAWSEPTLLRIAFAFEQATKARRPPKFLPTILPG
jgi:amidase